VQIAGPLLLAVAILLLLLALICTISTSQVSTRFKKFQKK
jgi:hypothetical protein